MYGTNNGAAAGSLETRAHLDSGEDCHCTFYFFFGLNLTAERLSGVCHMIGEMSGLNVTLG